MFYVVVMLLNGGIFLLHPRATPGLVVDSVTIVFANPLGCSNETGQEVLLDSMQHQKRYFTSTACGNRLRLHLLNSSVIQLVDNAGKFLATKMLLN